MMQNLLESLTCATLWRTRCTVLMPLENNGYLRNSEDDRFFVQTADQDRFLAALRRDCVVV